MATIAVNRRPTSRYRAPVTQRHQPPLPPEWPQPFGEPPSLTQFFLLSMLLHALLIALFGAPSGGSREGRAMWGSMNVELRGPLFERPVEVMPVPTRQDRPESQGAVPMTPPAETEAAAVAPSGPAIVEVPTPFPRLLDRVVKPDNRLVDPPALVVPPPTEGRDLRPPPRERPTPSTAAVPEPLPISPNVGLERALAEPPTITVPLAQPATPVPTPAPAPVPLQEQRVRVEPVVPITRPVETPPVEVRAIPVPTLDGVVPRAELSAPAPVELTPMPDIQAAPVAPPVERIAPRTAPPPVETPLPQREAGPSFGRPPAPGAPGRRGRPEDPAGSYDPTAPSVDLDAVRRRAGELAREGTGARAVLPFPMPPVPAKKSQMETAIENARKPDCRTAYQGLGLLAAVPLIANEFGEGNCRW